MSELYIASQNGNLETVKILCPNTNEYTYDYSHSLYISAINGHLNIVKYFCNNINIKSDALVWASYAGHLNIVKYLLEAGADITSNNNHSFRVACDGGHLHVVKYLYEAGADIHALNDCAIIWASFRGHLNVIKYLVSLGADIQAQNNASLRWASAYEHLEVVKYLIDLGAHFDISQRCMKYILFCRKMQNKIRERAQKKIYFWWIPICYSLTHHSGCGKRMMQKNWEKTNELIEFLQ
jgi:ankyrin repeat protein